MYPRTLFVQFYISEGFLYYKFTRFFFSIISRLVVTII
uniref:Uncharacterized protein n=1 Tax=virus sp. ctx9V1 TaxID=2828001 RepID=A0A8S5RDT2_9VIRU|nr:MAG TPA: hypothetical protein [virus sp. ctx9V1]